MSTVTTVNGFPEVQRGAKLLGEIVSWDVIGCEVRFSHLRDALRDAGLDEAVARKMFPSNAFKRAARRLEKDRIIRRVGAESDTEIRFQFTREDDTGGELVYTREAQLTLNKETGVITGDDPSLVSRAVGEFDAAMERRTSSDITSVIQRLFVDRTRPGLDLIPIRAQGGAYYVRADASDFVDRVADFIDRLHGRLMRLPIAAGFGHGEAAVKESVAEKMAGLIAELNASVADFGADTSPRAVKGAAERVKLIRHKIASYTAYLDDRRESLQTALDDAVNLIREKVAGVCGAAADGD